MNIAAILDSEINAGGGFNQALNAITGLIDIAEGSHCVIVYTSIEKNIKFLRDLGVTAKVYKFGVIDKLLAALSSNFFWRRLQGRLKLIGLFEKLLISDGIDLVYFSTPTLRGLCLQKLNYISTVWDLSHRDTPEFPEVREFGEFLIREHQFKSTLAQSVLIVCDSLQLVDSISLRYGIDKERMIPMPFMPAPFISEKYSRNKIEVLSKLGLKPGYFYYPAQFWAHKNHIRIIQALHILNKVGNNFQVVFSGGDKGNLQNLKNAVKHFNLENSVQFIGFVDVEDIRALYQGAAAVLMPSYFGPTNLPPLEAWTIGVPLIQSSSFTMQASDAAIFADPDSDCEWADAMQRIMNKEVASLMVERGARRMEEIIADRKSSELALLNALRKFEIRLESWKGWKSFD